MQPERQAESGWYTDPSDPTRERYWDQRWTKQTRTADTTRGSQREQEAAPGAGGPPSGDSPALRAESTFAIRRALGAAIAILVVAAVAVVVWFLVQRDQTPAPGKDDSLDGLVYQFVSPKVPCCANQRNEGTSEFTVDGTWAVQWELDGVGKDCQVIGRIVDPSKNRFADLKPFGSGVSGEQTYSQPGTYSIALEYNCPDDSIATAQIRVFDRRV